LHYAAKEGHSNACRFLITHKIDTLIVKSNGQTAFDIASTSDIQQLFLSK
jgi:ankyrin repeat protein